jgi:hypothetical protein
MHTGGRGEGGSGWPGRIAWRAGAALCSWCGGAQAQAQGPKVTAGLASQQAARSAVVRTPPVLTGRLAGCSHGHCIAAAARHGADASRGEGTGHAGACVTTGEGDRASEGSRSRRERGCGALQRLSHHFSANERPRAARARRAARHWVSPVREPIDRRHACSTTPCARPRPTGRGVLPGGAAADLHRAARPAAVRCCGRGCCGAGRLSRGDSVGVCEVEQGRGTECLRRPGPGRPCAAAAGKLRPAAAGKIPERPAVPRLAATSCALAFCTPLCWPATSCRLGEVCGRATMHVTVRCIGNPPAGAVGGGGFGGIIQRERVHAVAGVW